MLILEKLTATTLYQGNYYLVDPLLVLTKEELNILPILVFRVPKLKLKWYYVDDDCECVYTAKSGMLGLIHEDFVQDKTIFDKLNQGKYIKITSDTRCENLEQIIKIGEYIVPTNSSLDSKFSEMYCVEMQQLGFAKYNQANKFFLLRLHMMLGNYVSPVMK